MKFPEKESLRTYKKHARGVQTSSPDLNKRCHKRANQYALVPPFKDHNGVESRQRGSLQYR